MRYFKEVLENIKLYNEFDVYGHLDYVVRYGGYLEKKIEYSEFREILDGILISIISKDKGIEISERNLKNARKKFYVHSDEKKKPRYIEGSDKYNKAKQSLNNASRDRSADELAAIGHSYRKSSAGKGHKSGISDRERKNLEEKRKKESKEIRRKEFHKLASKNEFAFLDVDII